MPQGCACLPSTRVTIGSAYKPSCLISHTHDHNKVGIRKAQVATLCCATLNRQVQSAWLQYRSQVSSRFSASIGSVHLCVDYNLQYRRRVVLLLGGVLRGVVTCLDDVNTRQIHIHLITLRRLLTTVSTRKIALFESSLLD